MSYLFLGSDHAGFELKKKLIPFINEKFPFLQLEDCGCFEDSSVDYPEFAQKVAQKVVSHVDARGILICGSGIGMSIAANKIPGIRAANVWSKETAKLSREHNDSNILCLGARLLNWELCDEIIEIWLNTPFLGGRHLNRINLISKIEGKNS